MPQKGALLKMLKSKRLSDRKNLSDDFATRNENAVNREVCYVYFL